MRNQTVIALALTTGLSFGFAAENAGVASVKTYLLERLSQQKTGTAQLETAADKYLALAKAVNFDYAKLASQGETVRVALKDARAGWSKASPIYESIEGIVAGVETRYLEAAGTIHGFATMRRMMPSGQDDLAEFIADTLRMIGR